MVCIFFFFSVQTVTPFSTSPSLPWQTLSFNESFEHLDVHFDKFPLTWKWLIAFFTYKFPVVYSFNCKLSPSLPPSLSLSLSLSLSFSLTHSLSLSFSLSLSLSLFLSLFSLSLSLSLSLSPPLSLSSFLFLSLSLSLRSLSHTLSLFLSISLARSQLLSRTNTRKHASTKKISLFVVSSGRLSNSLDLTRSWSKPFLLSCQWVMVKYASDVDRGCCVPRLCAFTCDLLQHSTFAWSPRAQNRPIFQRSERRLCGQAHFVHARVQNAFMKSYIKVEIYCEGGLPRPAENEQILRQLTRT